LYRLGFLVNKYSLPFRLIEDGDIVIQVGAPSNLLRLGRSRAAYFSHFVGMGEVIVFEPEEQSVEALHRYCRENTISNMDIHNYGVWSRPDVLRFLVNKKHPSCSLVESVYSSDREDIDDFDTTEIRVESIDNILSAKYSGVAIKLLSLTSNGSEIEILEGCRELLPIVQYLSVVGNRHDFDFLSTFGFEFLSEDNRGYLFQNTRLLGK